MDKVIFDTNAYRYLVKGKDYDQIEKLMAKIKSREKKNNIETLLSPIVAKELLAHVADKNDPAFDQCLNAIKALYLHNGDETSYRFIATPEMLMAKAFFDKELPQNEENNKALVQICFHLAKNPSRHVFRKFAKNLRLNKQHVEDAEKGFAYSMKKLLNDVDPAATGWQFFKDDEKKRKQFLANVRSDYFSFTIAFTFLIVPMEMLIYSGQMEMLDDAELTDRIRKFMEIFPEPIALQKQVIENMVGSEYNLLEENRANFLWDTQLMFNIGNHSVGGGKLYFVTDDQAMIRNAIANNARYSILTFSEYMAYIG